MSCLPKGSSSFQLRGGGGERTLLENGCGTQGEKKGYVQSNDGKRKTKRRELLTLRRVP